MTDAMKKALSEINDNLSDMNAGFSVGISFEVPLRLEIGNREFRDEVSVSLFEKDGFVFDKEDLLRFFYESVRKIADEEMPFDSFEEFREHIDDA